MTYAQHSYTWFERTMRSLVHRRLAQLKHGSLRIADPLETRSFGQPGHELAAEVRVVKPSFYGRTAWGGGLGAAEALMDGDWECSDLVSLVRIFVRNMQVSDAMDQGVATLRWLAARWQHAWRRNTRTGSVQNIREHYDLGNEFYSLMLDESLCYSAGIFEREESTLHEASLAKMDRLCRQLDLQPDDHLLEIGSGWGGLALHAARHYGCRVTTTTISRQQFELAAARAREAGLANRITVLQSDYRDLSGMYDKLISVEMIEAVGHEYFPLFFSRCRELVRPGGKLALQAILIRDDRYQQHLGSVDFIRKYIFPGGCLPCRAVLQSLAHRCGWELTEEADITAHYVRTLQAWRKKFWQQIDAVRSLGFTERFIRMWNYYLCYCEAGFRERQTLTSQFLFTMNGISSSARQLHISGTTS